MMEESRKLPEFGSVEEFAEFFDNNDTGNYLDAMPEVQFDVSRGREAWKRKRNMVAIDKALMEKVRARAEAEHTSAEALINGWVEEKTLQPA